MPECSNCISEPKLEVLIILERTNLGSLVWSNGKKSQFKCLISKEVVIDLIIEMMLMKYSTRAVNKR